MRNPTFYSIIINFFVGNSLPFISYKDKRFHLLGVSLIIFFSLFATFSYSQTEFVNNGADIVNSNSIFVINGNVSHQLDGTINNTGHFYVRGDWKNNNDPGNTIFAAGPNGWVHLDSGSQTIAGSHLTHFNNLELAGTGIKKLLNVDVEIEDTLALNDHEFDAGDNTVFVLSTDTGSITRSVGFVSNTNNGSLARNTFSEDPYFFAVGSSVGTPRFRPVTIAAKTAAANTFRVRFANADPTIETFDRQIKEEIVGDINPNFFHKINRTAGTDKADITVYYDQNTDGVIVYDINAYWDDVSAQWKNPGLAVASSNYGFSGLTSEAFDNFSAGPSLIPFALSINVEISTSIFVANVFSPNADGNNDVLHMIGKGITDLQFLIYDRWGEKVFETNDINIGWDGTYKGEPLNIGVFVYFIKGKLKNGDDISKKGNVTLMR